MLSVHALECVKALKTGMTAQYTPFWAVAMASDSREGRKRALLTYTPVFPSFTKKGKPHWAQSMLRTVLPYFSPRVGAPRRKTPAPIKLI